MHHGYISAPRQCVFALTVNSLASFPECMDDPMFLTIRCGSIDIQGLTRDRDQLGAEAVRAHLTAATPKVRERSYLTRMHKLKG